MSFTDPQVTDFKQLFNRDFPYGGTSGDLTTVQDQDITNALSDMDLNINQGLFSDQNTYFQAALQLAAHYLVMNLRASSQGIGGSFSFMASSKGVGGISEGFSIPSHITENPVFSSLCTTRYGAKYLLMVLPNLGGQIFTVCGAANP